MQWFLDNLAMFGVIFLSVCIPIYIAVVIITVSRGK